MKATSYVALLRGIMPTNPAMRNENLRKVFEGLGFANVATVIASGNVLFETTPKHKGKNTLALETLIEKALHKELGLTITTIVRNKEQLEELVKQNPFKTLAHGKQTYLTITFLKTGKHVANVIDTTTSKTPDFMSLLEKEHGKGITTRTWKTVERLVAKLHGN